MATALRAEQFKGIPAAWLDREAFDKRVRKARRAVADARAAGEDFVAGAGREVRRHPLMAVGFAAGAGLLAGGLVGAAAGWLFGARR